MYGYHGVIAEVDLKDQRIRIRNFDESFARQFIGGSGMGAYFLLLLTDPATPPLAPEAPLIYMTGPFMGTGIPTSGRHQIIAKSPLTGIFGESDAGGSFGFNLKRAGFDGLIITGKSKEPVILCLDDGEISFMDSRDLWGLDTYETERILKKRFDDKIAVSCIGPAGENCLPIAGIFHDGRHARAAGRCGLGAVMGSKNLKAVIARGSKNIQVADKERLIRSIIDQNALLKEKGAGLTLYGTSGGMEAAERSGDLPIRNWKQGSWEDEAGSISGQKMAEVLSSGDSFGCIACPVRCGREIILEEGGEPLAGPEYESMAMLGSACLVNDLKAVSQANDICNRSGFDTISAGSAVAFAMELFESGIIDRETIGRDLNWGDGEAMLATIRDIAESRGFGKILGQGTRKAAEIIGRGSERFAIHSKGLELPAHDARCFKGMACGYATSNRGACHLTSFTYPWERSSSFPELGYFETANRTQDEGKGVMTAKFQDLMGVVDSLKICKFALILSVKISTLIDWIGSVTGWDITQEELMKIGERIFLMKRIYNTGLGLSRKEDTLPKRILEESRDSGGSKGYLPDLEKQLDEYYAYRKWSMDGIPDNKHLADLGIGNFSSWSRYH